MLLSLCLVCNYLSRAGWSEQLFVAYKFGSMKSNPGKAVTDSSAQAHTEVVSLQEL